jgi:pentatricopeptide repeat protein
MLAFAKTKDLQKVLELEEVAKKQHGILPSVHRLNSVVLAYTKVGKVNEAEHFIKEMRDVQGVLPDVVTYTTLIQGYR